MLSVIMLSVVLLNVVAPEGVVSDTTYQRSIYMCDLKSPISQACAISNLNFVDKQHLHC
jgi:hypothetical protein